MKVINMFFGILVVAMGVCIGLYYFEVKAKPVEKPLNTLPVGIEVAHITGENDAIVYKIAVDSSEYLIVRSYGAVGIIRHK